MDYQKWLTEIRPEILTINADFSLTEQFQNITVRPILKLLNNTIIEFSKTFIASLEISFENKTTFEIEKTLDNLFKKHPTFKVYLIGMVISYLTTDELRVYLENQKTINKRIYILLQERLKSQISLLRN
jgi:hypothetical protein